MKKRQNRSPTVVAGMGEQESVWALRLLLRTNAQYGFFAKTQHAEDREEILKAAGFPKEVALEEDTGKLRKLMASRLKALESEPWNQLSRSTTGHNGRLLARHLGLDDHETEVLALVVAVFADQNMEHAFSFYRIHNRRQQFQLLSTVTGIPAGHINRVLGIRETLADAGLITMESYGHEFTERFSVLDSLPEILELEHDGIDSILSHYLIKAEPVALTLDDFPHLREEVTFMQQILTAALSQRAKGVNVLLHGPSGCGKTALVRMLAQEMGIALYVVPDEGDDGEAIMDRMQSYRFCQRLLQQGKSLLLFDEMTDALPSVGSHWFDFSLRNRQRSADKEKARINNLLEKNATPALWLGNSADMDPAHLRRFSLVLRVDRPPRSVRRRMLDKGYQGMAGDDLIGRLSELEITPAIVAKSAQITRLIGPEDRNEAEAILQKVVRNSLEAVGETFRLNGHADPLGHYDTALLNADIDLEEVIAGLASKPEPRVNILLIGPPGTGKTAFARHLAQRLDRPLLVKAGSDLISMWVGETEKNLAEMFRQAEREGAVLMLDEADSFIRDRGGAFRSWEVTQTNELLMRLEQFQGVFCCATNHMDALDGAAFRRFDIKASLDYLKADQRQQLFIRTVGHEDLNGIADRLNRLDTLTPGDYRTVVQRQRILGQPLTASFLMDGLEAECRAKPGGQRRPIGFTTH